LTSELHRLHKCIQACPVDAIVGATRAMHTVMSDLCTGCNLCVAPCPTQCIELRSGGDDHRNLEMGSSHHSGAQYSCGTTHVLFSAFRKDKVWDFNGGIHPPEMKTQSNGTPLRQVSLPQRLSSR
jgi:ferredoxin